MKIYVGHSSSFDYKNELYRPIRESSLAREHEFVLPHEHSDNPGNTYDKLASCDLLVAEISDKSTGLGIELGWADRAGVPIVCISRGGASFSPSIRTVCQSFFTYNNATDLIRILEDITSRNTAHND